MTWRLWTDTEYHAADGYISRGGIKRACESLRVFRGHEDGSLSDDSTSDAAELGTLAHMAILQPDRFDLEVTFKPPIDKRRKNSLDVWGGFIRDDGSRVLGKVAGEKWERDNTGKIVATEEQHILALGMACAVMADKTAARLVQGRTEQALTWIDPETGEPCKALFDALPNDRHSADLKCTFDPSPNGFERMCIRDMLHIQDAHYTMGLAVHHGVPWHEIPAMTFVAVRSKPPHEVALHWLGQPEREAGRDIVRAAIDDIHACRKSDTWRNQWEGGDPNLITFPPYALRNPLRPDDA